MAVGDAVCLVEAIATTAYSSLQPASTEEWVIHNISHDADAELHFYQVSGTLDITVDVDASAGAWRGNFHCKNACYYRVKNTNAGTKNIGYDGIISHT